MLLLGICLKTPFLAENMFAKTSKFDVLANLFSANKGILKNHSYFNILGGVNINLFDDFNKCVLLGYHSENHFPTEKEISGSISV